MRLACSKVKDDTVLEHPCSRAPCILFEAAVVSVAPVLFLCPAHVVRMGGTLSAVEHLRSECAVVRLEVAVDSGVTSWNRAAVCALGDFCRLVSSLRAWAPGGKTGLGWP